MSAPAAAPSSPAPATGKKNEGHEFEPPLFAIKKILKASLPEHSTVGRDAQSAFSRAAGIFILYLTSAANDFAHDNKRATIGAQDVLQAIKEVEYGQFSEQMEKFLEIFKEEEDAAKNKKKAEKEAKEGVKTADEEEKPEDKPEESAAGDAVEAGDAAEAGDSAEAGEVAESAMVVDAPESVAPNLNPEQQ